MNFYNSAGLALDHLDKNQGSVKGSLAAAGVQSTGGESKRILALVIETLKYKPVLLQLMTTTSIQSLEKLTFPRKTPRNTPSSQSLLLVLLHDLLFSSKGKIEASDKWQPKASVLRHQARLKAELVKLQIREGKSRKEDLARSGGEGEMVRYVRYNPNAGRTIGSLFEHLESASVGMKKLDEAVYPVPNGRYFLDPHLDEVLLAFPGNTTWWLKDEWYEQGGIILQDKASCMPAKVLMEGWQEGEGECIDATAAPGNKTSYISALMHNRGKLYAFERSPNRFKTLERMLSKAHCKNVTAQRADFLESDPDDKQFSQVTRILLDPSCSGSGIVNRLDYLVEDEVEETDAKAERLEKLASFQLQMIQHAFKFPSVKRIVYSTCSIHAEEDERVVLSALKSAVGKSRGWALAPRSGVIPSWERRGRSEEMAGDEDLAQGVIRCLPEDKTNGFFVACFVRGDPTGLSHRPQNRSTAGKPATQATTEATVEPEQPGQRAEVNPTRKSAAGGKKRKGDPGDAVVPQVAGEKANKRARAGAKDAAAPTAPASSVVVPADAGETPEVKEKTAAQLERARRKKAAQKAKSRDKKPTAS
ncbi:hypothetical protein IAU60_004636 [Kwoniella sp. DSM 27419]